MHPGRGEDNFSSTIAWAKMARMCIRLQASSYVGPQLDSKQCVCSTSLYMHTWKLAFEYLKSCKDMSIHIYIYIGPTPRPFIWHASQNCYINNYCAFQQKTCVLQWPGGGSAFHWRRGLLKCCFFGKREAHLQRQQVPDMIISQAGAWPGNGAYKK